MHVKRKSVAIVALCLAVVFTLIVCVFPRKQQLAPGTVHTFVGKNYAWQLETTFEWPAAEDNQNPYFEVIYSYLGDIPYDEHGKISFSWGTSDGSVTLTYDKDVGYIDPGKREDDLDRIRKINDHQFVVLYEREPFLNFMARCPTGSTFADDGREIFQILAFASGQWNATLTPTAV